MKFFYVFSARKLKKLSVIIVAALFTAGILYIDGQELMVFSTDKGPQVFYKGDVEDKKIALTFNISWGDKQVQPILDILKEKKAKATFFLSATWAERYPELAKQICEAGHEIGSHGYAYDNYTSWDDEKIRRDMLRSKQILTELTHKTPTLLRPPTGQFDKRVLDIADKLDLSVIHWSINSHDWQNPGADTIVGNVINQLKKGDIIMLHASDSALQTDKALPTLIDQLKGKGYQFSHVTELIFHSEAKSEQIN